MLDWGYIRLVAHRSRHKWVKDILGQDQIGPYWSRDKSGPGTH